MPFTSRLSLTAIGTQCNGSAVPARRSASSFCASASRSGLTAMNALSRGSRWLIVSSV
jgi:hypothetical protein